MEVDSINPHKGAVSVLHDLREQLKNNKKEEQDTLERHKQEIERHKQEIGKILNLRDRIELTITNLLEFYPETGQSADDDKQNHLGGHPNEPINSPIVDNILVPVEKKANEDQTLEVVTDGLKEDEDDEGDDEDEQEEEDEDPKDTKVKKRRKGTVRPLILSAISSLDNFVSLEDVIVYLTIHHKDANLVSKDIRTSLKDSRRAKKLVGIPILQKDTGVKGFLNGLPEFFDDVEQKTVKSEYEEKLLNKLIENNLETIEAVDL